MDLKKINNLPELFFCQYNEQKDRNKILLSSLREFGKNYSWEQTFEAINNLSSELKKYVNKGDRCLLISENRPEWFISDLSIMLADSITVPAYTTYAERDYEYIISDCTPSVIFVSNTEQFNKIKNIIKSKDFVKKIFSFEKLEEKNKDEYTNINDLILNSNISNNFETKITRKDPACIIYTSGKRRKSKRSNIKSWWNFK